MAVADAGTRARDSSARRVAGDAVNNVPASIAKVPVLGRCETMLAATANTTTKDAAAKFKSFPICDRADPATLAAGYKSVLYAAIT